MTDITANDVLRFWFEDIEHVRWFKRDPNFDKELEQRFGGLLELASNDELEHWCDTPHGTLALIIVLDQFSRNMFRDSPLSFANDSLALALAQEAILLRADKELSSVQRSILYLPFMHSESLKIHEIAMLLYKENGIEANLAFEIKHKEIIEKFGRYPHRNNILGRSSTKEEIEFLKQEGSSF